MAVDCLRAELKREFYHTISACKYKNLGIDQDAHHGVALFKLSVQSGRIGCINRKNIGCSRHR